MMRLHPLQMKRREDAARGSKEGRKEKKYRMRRRKIFEEAWEQAVWENIVSGGVGQALKALRIEYLNGTQQSNWGRELRWLEKQDPEIVEYYVWIVDEFNKGVEYRDERRQEMTKIVASGAQRQQISWEIDVSIQQEVRNEKGNSEKKITLGKKVQKSKKRQVKRREEGSKRIVTRRDGLVWILPQEVPEDNTCRNEQKRRELTKRWEAPPLGPE